MTLRRHRYGPATFELAGVTPGATDDVARGVRRNFVTDIGELLLHGADSLVFRDALDNRHVLGKRSEDVPSEAINYEIGITNSHRCTVGPRISRAGGDGGASHQRDSSVI